MGIGEIGDRLRRSTVLIRNGGNSSGSGVIWGASGAIVTNDHVVRCSDLTIEFWDGEVARARVDRRDRPRDLAILCVDAGGVEHANPGDSGRIRTGEFVIAVGNPFGFTGALSTGIVHGVGTVRDLGGQSFIQTTVRSVRIPGANGGIAILVLDVIPGSPADFALLRAGDLLIGAGGRPFTSIDDLREALDNANGGLTVQFRRGGHVMQREATVRLVPGVAA